jgi:hypothetical protein
MVSNDPARHAICSVMARLIAFVIAAIALAACASHVADYIPTWPAVLRRICRRGLVPRNMTPSGRKWMPRLPAIRARTLLRQKPTPESLVCPSKRLIFLPSRLIAASAARSPASDSGSAARGEVHGQLASHRVRSLIAMNCPANPAVMPSVSVPLGHDVAAI